MKVYLAGSFRDQERVRLLTKQLQDLGFETTNKWQDEPKGIKEAEWATYANRDLTAVDKADVFVVLTDRPSTTGGYHTEFGWAAHGGKALLVVGPKVNFFHSLAQVNRVPDWARAKKWLTQWEEKTIKKS